METYKNMNDFLDGIDLTDEGPESFVPQQAPVGTYNPRTDEGEVEFAHHLASTPHAVTGDIQVIRPVAPAPWNPRLTFDVAMEEDTEVLLERYGLTEAQLESFMYNLAFRREVVEHQRTIREEGITFRAKARIQAEMYLETLDDIVTDASVSAATRLDAIKSVVKWGDLEPKPDKTESQNGSKQIVQVQINL